MSRAPTPDPCSRRAVTSRSSAVDDLKGRSFDPSTNHVWTRHTQETEQRLARLAPGESLYGYTGSWRRLCLGVPSPAVKGNHGSPHVHYELPRVISVREMARLQSFPDEFIFEGDTGEMMEQVGNAVPPLLGKHLGLALRPGLEQVASELAPESPMDD